MNKLFILSFLFISHISFSQTSIQGIVTDAETGEPIIFGTVALYWNDILITGNETDLDGIFHISELDSGVYDMVFSYTGYGDKKIASVFIQKGKTKTLNVKMIRQENMEIEISGCFSGYPYWQDDLTQGFIFSTEKISRMPHR